MDFKLGIRRFVWHNSFTLWVDFGVRLNALVYLLSTQRVPFYSFFVDHESLNLGIRKIDLLCVQSLQMAAEEKMKTVDQPIGEQALKQNFWA